MKILDNPFGIHERALSVRNERLEMIASNIANADTPRYRAKDLPEFKETLRGVRHGQKATRSRHLNGSTGLTLPATERRQAQDPNGNTVSLEEEMVRGVNAKRQHDRALAIYRSNLTILRTSLGRN